MSGQVQLLQGAQNPQTPVRIIRELTGSDPAHSVEFVPRTGTAKVRSMPPCALWQRNIGAMPNCINSDVSDSYLMRINVRCGHVEKSA